MAEARGKFISFEGGEGAGKSTQIKLLSDYLTEQNIPHIITREPGGTPLAERVRPLLVQELSVVSCQLSDKGEGAGSEPHLSHWERSKVRQHLSGEGVNDHPLAPKFAEHSAHPHPKSLPAEDISTSPSGRGTPPEDWDPLAETLLFLAARVQHWRVKIAPALAAGQWVLCDRFTDSTLVYQGIAKGLGVEYLQQLQRMVLGDISPDLTFLLDIDPKIGLTRANKRGEGEDRFEQLGLNFHQKLREGFLQLASKEPKRFLVVDASQEVHTIQSCLQGAINV